MNKNIEMAIRNGRIVLVLGAGASFNSRNKKGENPPLGNSLAKIISSAYGEDYDDDSLQDCYAAGLVHLGVNGINDILAQNFKNCTAAPEYIELIKYPFPRIYTFNIDDSFERAASSASDLAFNVFRRGDKIKDFDSLYSRIDLIKLNGDINFPADGFIFSPSEYGEGSANEPYWYQELARDFHRFTFVFIGTELNEPLFRHQVEKYKVRTGDQSMKSYLIVPSMKKSQIAALSGSNIEYIDGKFCDFTDWLKTVFNKPISGLDILKQIRPEFNVSNAKNNNLFENITAVSRASLSIANESYSPSVKMFYKGFKPTWQEVMLGVPAKLKSTTKILDKLKQESTRIFALLGPAGSGKSTALMQLALELSETSVFNVYYMNGLSDDVKGLAKALDQKNQDKCYLFLDRFAEIAYQISEIISENLAPKVIFVGAENVRIWNDRVREHLDSFSPVTQDYSSISEDDVLPILNKIRDYGNWTRLEKMSERNRRLEILRKAKKQLLIGLMEATSGEGYNEIIKREFSSISDESERALLLLTGLATMQRSEASEAVLTRALAILGVNPNVYELSQKMVGLISYSNGRLNTRHRVYVEKLMSMFVSELEIKGIIKAYIDAFSVYDYPIVVNIPKKDAAVYKGLVNFKFLKKILKDNKESILEIYESFEKTLEQEGLFLLQYGLALRSYGQNKLSLEKLSVARAAFPESPHIEHAYAFQLLILAESEQDENVAINYVERAKEVLRELDKINKFEGDRYPIISLSIGHVKVFHAIGRLEEARRLSKDYHDELSIRFRHQYSDKESRVFKTKKFLMHYYTTGILKSPKIDDY